MSQSAASSEHSATGGTTPRAPKVYAHGMQGRLFVVCGPSGAGKTSLVRTLVENDPEISLSVSHTTRAPRKGEQDGVHYFFTDDATFAGMVEKNEFAEHAQVFDRSYGTSKAAVQGALENGQDVMLEIDWQGARQVRKSWPSAIGIFILPPSLQSLEERLRARSQDSEDTIERRMKSAIAEISHHHESDYLVVNESFDAALGQMQAVVLSARLSHGRQAGRYGKLLRSLSQD